MDTPISSFSGAPSPALAPVPAAAPVPTTLDLFEEVESSAEAMQRLLQQQQQEHQAMPYPTWAVRQERIERLQRLLEHHADAFTQAIAQDFGHRATQETQLAEIDFVLSEIKYVQRKLKSWMRARRVPTALPFWPASNRLLRQPLGVVGVVAPWNYPLQLALSPALGALAAGNRVMIKPSEHTGRFAQLLRQAVSNYFSPGEMAVLPGGVQTAQAFVQLPFDHLVFTGSTAVGRQVAEVAARNLTPVTLELGGKSPVLIDRSADLALAAQRIAYAKLFNAGQTCVAPDYVLVHRSQQEAFVQAYSQAVRRMYPSIAGNDDYTSIIHQAHFSRLLALLEEAHAHSAPIVVLGETEPALRRLAPCLVLDPPLHSRLMQEEIFGPVLPVLTYDNTDQALGLIRSRAYPLALYWFGHDGQERERVLNTTLSGGVCINDCLFHLAQQAQPFGGVGASGMGVYHGEWGFRTFSKEKPVFIQSRFSVTQWLQAPYGKRFEQLMQLKRFLP